MAFFNDAGTSRREVKKKKKKKKKTNLTDQLTDHSDQSIIGQIQLAPIGTLLKDYLARTEKQWSEAPRTPARYEGRRTPAIAGMQRYQNTILKYVKIY